MPGHLGNVKTTVQNLEIVKVDVQNNYILVKGSIPGAKNSFVVIKEAVKGLPAKEAIKLVDVKEVLKMNELVEKAKKYNIEVLAGMTSAELEPLITKAEEEAAAEAEGDK